jgi:hypothetical protein
LKQENTESKYTIWLKWDSKRLREKSGKRLRMLLQACFGKFGVIGLQPRSTGRNMMFALDALRKRSKDNSI